MVFIIYILNENNWIVKFYIVVNDKYNLGGGIIEFKREIICFNKKIIVGFICVRNVKWIYGDEKGWFIYVWLKVFLGMKWYFFEFMGE